MENCLDRRVHGTMLDGESNPMAKLTQQTVDEMRSHREQYKTPYYKLAKMFDVSTMTAFRAATNRSWK